MNKQEEVYLRDLRPGAVFVTRDGTYAVKSEYFYTGDKQSQCQCVLLASGEYAHFRDGNETLVREASVAGLAESVTSPSTELLGERDTHFANWASSVWDELHTLCTRKIDEADKERYEAMDKAIIARAGYDLVYFLLDKAEYHSGSFDVGWGTPGEIHEAISHLPDMTKWPVEPSDTSESNPA